VSDNIPWQPPPEGVDLDQGAWLIPKELYDHLMSLPPGTDVSAYFKFEPGWNLTATTFHDKEST